jgi:hypothetical protein
MNLLELLMALQQAACTPGPMDIRVMVWAPDSDGDGCYEPMVIDSWTFNKTENRIELNLTDE